MQPQVRQGTLRPRRTSAFRETGLFEDEPQPSIVPLRPILKVRFRSTNDIFESPTLQDEDGEWEDVEESDSDTLQYITIPETSSRGSMAALIRRLGLLSFVLAAIFTVSHMAPFTKPLFGASGAAFTQPVESHTFSRRDSPTNYCKRWSQQSAIVNGTLYIYGGRKTTSSSQTSNTWTNDFLTIDLKKTWQISSPSMSGLIQPSDLPPVANGYLWNSHDSLYLYGGEFSDNPQTTPTAFSLWEYNIASSSWIEHQNPQTSGGTNSEAAGMAIQRAAEGAGASLASLGRGWYFGGHLDFLTTDGWSIQTPRVYLKSFIEFTFPGTSNKDLQTQTVGSDGAWRNITQAGIQSQAGFTQRADGLLVYIPGFGADGILLSLGGGTNETFTQMNEVDIFDIAESTWYRQATSGETPTIRVNPCAVVAAAADGSSYNVYMFGGQNLIPYGNQTQFQDMWILSIPAFAWIPVNMNGQSVPYPRAGHTCNIWDGQMVVVGGYIGTEISCEAPGVYSFNTSSLQWMNQYTSLSASGDKNPFSQQKSQEGVDGKPGLEGSYGYEIPAAVQSVIGGGVSGGATVTAPLVTATAGPMQTGKPITYTVTGPGGAVITTTPSSGSRSSHSGTNVAAIVAGVVAGIFGLLALYLAFCAYIYRKRIKIYEQHMAMVHEQQQSEKDRASLEAALTGVTATSSSNASWKKHNPHNSMGQSSLIGPYHHRPSQSADTTGGNSGSGEERRDSSEVESLLEGMEPSFFGVMMNPRRNLRIVNRD